MLRSALRHPIRSRTASASMLAAEDADAVFHAYGTYALGLEFDECCCDELAFLMSMLLHASQLPTACPSVVELAHPSLDWLPRDDGTEGDCLLALLRRLEEGIVMDAGAVRRAIAHWSELNDKDPDRSSGQAAFISERMMRVVRAAERYGQGVIVHDGCFLTAEV